jgi:signal transduction histidine kinase
VFVSSDGKIKGSAWFDPAPLPQDEGPAFELFRKGEFEEVATQHPGALSPAGVPLGPMAAFRLLQQAQDDGVARQRAKTLRELCFAFPSIISPELLDQADTELARRGLADSSSARWLDRWKEVSKVARAVEELRRQPLPQAGVVVLSLDGAFWRVESRNQENGRTIELTPLADALPEIRKRWDGIPSGGGIHLALTASSANLLHLPEDSSKWPQTLIPIKEAGVEVIALGDPAMASRAVWLRITILGGGCLLAAVMLSAVWWRQQGVLRIQKDLSRQKDDFLSTVSHELRTPAASIQLLAENLASGAVEDPESIRIYHDRLVMESRRLVSTTEHLLDFALMERGFKQYRFQALDTRVLADEVRQVLTPLAARKGIELSVNAPSIEPTPQADFDAIRRATVNLVDNAIKFSPPSSRVDLLIESLPPGRWIIRVTDHGPGIPLADQSRIFDRFHRGGNVLDRETRGTGIGLAVVKRIIESHQGSVELTQSSDAGSVFTCVLPLVPTQSESSHENPVDRG